MYKFPKPGYKNSEKAIEILKRSIPEYGVKEVIVASTYGATGLAAAKALADLNVKLIVITHNFGFKEPGTLEMKPETRAELESLGVEVHTGTMPFRNIGTAIRSTLGYSQQDLIANTLRIFCQGVKVCVEIVMMASDSGLIGTRDVLAMAGTARGADTVALIKPASSNKFFELKVREILAKPFDW